MTRVGFKDGNVIDCTELRVNLTCVSIAPKRYWFYIRICHDHKILNCYFAHCQTKHTGSLQRC